MILLVLGAWQVFYNRKDMENIWRNMKFLGVFTEYVDLIIVAYM